MDSHTYDLLNSRIESAHIYVGESKTNSIYRDLTVLAKEIEKIYNEHPQYQTLYDTITKLDIWDKFNPDNINSEENDNDDQQQLQMLGIKYPSVIQALNTLAQLSTMDINKILNCVSVAGSKTQPNMNQVTADALQHEERVKQVTHFFHKLVVKSLIVLERYAQVIDNENRFWIQVEEKLSASLNRDNTKLYNKY